MPKKKTKKAAGAGAGGAGGGGAAASEATHQPLVLPPDREKWVTLGSSVAVAVAVAAVAVGVVVVVVVVVVAVVAVVVVVVVVVVAAAAAAAVQVAAAAAAAAPAVATTTTTTTTTTTSCSALNIFVHLVDLSRMSLLLIARWLPLESVFGYVLCARAWWADVKLVNWSFMDFKVRIRTDTPLFFLHKKLKERHGRMNELKLYKKSVNEDNIMVDEFKTFDDYGVPGGPKNSAAVVCLLL